MRALRLALAAFLFLGITVAGTGAEKKADDKAANKDKIVGTWEVSKSEGAPPGAAVEFTKDGKLKMTAKVKDQTISMEGTYTVEGDKLTTALKFGGKEQKETMTIKTLTDKLLITVDEKGKTDEFKRK